MSDLATIGADVEWPDSETGVAVRERLVARAELGRLAQLAEWVSGVRPLGAQPARVGLVLIGAEPGEQVAAAAEAAGVHVRTLVPGDGTDAALESGAAMADDEIESGTDLLLVAVPGVAADAAITVSVLTDTEPVKVLARGAAATDPAAWMDLAVTVRDTRRACMPHRDEPDDFLRELGSERLAAGAGLVLRTAARRTPVLLDGPVATAAALIAYESQPRAMRWWACADLGPDPLQDLAMSRTGQTPVLGLGSGLGDGLAGLLAVPVIRTAVTLAAG